MLDLFSFVLAQEAASTPQQDDFNLTGLSAQAGSRRAPGLSFWEALDAQRKHVKVIPKSHICKQWKDIVWN